MAELTENETTVVEQTIDTTTETQEVTQNVTDEPKVEKQETREKKFVTIDALHEERMRRRETSAKLADLEGKYAKAEERLQQLAERFKPQGPKYEENPAEYLRQNLEKTQSEIEEIRRFREEQASVQKQQQREMELINKYRSQADSFRAQTPDFDKAYQFLMEARLSELDAAGYSKDEAIQIIRGDEKALVEDAFKRELNPAERIYKMAKARGFVNEKPKAEEHIETLQEGVKASKTLSKGGGGTKTGQSLEWLAGLSDEDFSKLDEATFRKVMGG